MNFTHIPVLLNECLSGLCIKPDGIYVDGTAGGGGHSFEIAKQLKNGKLICIDRDSEAIAALKQRLSEFDDKIIFVQDNYKNLPDILDRLEIQKIDGILLDLGVSSHQLDTATRGFSYRFDAPLDMRMNVNKGQTAADIVNEYPLQKLANVISEYGEEKYAYSIAKNIVKKREEQKIKTTFELTEIIKSSMPFSAMKNRHPSKKTFQALRIEVNGELSAISTLMENIVSVLNKDARIVIISFHSLEDRIVKIALNELAKGCICSKELPVCICHNTPKIELITKKPITASEEELSVNKRSSSAKLRIAKKL
ncbi:MAG: 16S rRNA (cytosine(1402)-N(4))-methyltransferase RsmH [Clostridia bacterium]